MTMRKRIFHSALLAGFLAAAPARAEEVKPIAPEKFDPLHKMIRVQPDEQRFWQIPWKLTVTEARELAAKEGKPIFVWAGAGGAPIGVCWAAASAGRAPAIWTEEVVKLLKEKYVCVALDARKERGEYKDADGDFVRATNCVTVTASGSVCVVTAGGKALGPYSGPGPGMEKWLGTKLKDWEALPESERAPGAVKVPRAESVDPKRAALVLPQGALIVRVFNRHLGWDADKSLRYVVADDYLPNTNKASVERYGMAQNDFMWIPEKEWRAFIPAEPRKGDSLAVPASFALRLFRFHLDPCRGFSEGAAFQSSKADAGRLTLTVQEVTAAKLSLRLEGTARLQQSGREGPASYEPAILGFLEFDRSKNAFTRFDLLALGTATNLPTDANGVVTPRKGPYPLGIAFELVASPTTADRLHPRGARDNPAAYLEPKEK